MNAKQTDKEKHKARFINGPIHQVLSGTKRGRASICHSQKQAKPGSGLHSPLDHSLSKKSPKKSRFVKELSRAARARAQNTPLAQSVILLQFPENVGRIIARRATLIIAADELTDASCARNLQVSRNEIKVGSKLHGGVQLEWYKRVVPAGLNKITCGGEQTNTLSSDNEHCFYCCTTTHPGLRILCLVLS